MERRIANMSDEEFVREFATSESELLREVSRRMAILVDEAEGVESEHLETIKEYEEEAERDQKRFEEQEELLIEKTTEIENLTKELTMLEEQIEKLADRVGAVEKEQNTTNELLAQILDAIKGGGLPPAEAPALVVNNDNTPKEGPKVEQKNMADTKPEVAAPEEEKEPANGDTYTQSDAIKALTEVAKIADRDAAFAIVKKYAVGPVNINNVPDDKLVDIMNDCADVTRQSEAA